MSLFIMGIALIWRAVLWPLLTFTLGIWAYRKPKLWKAVLLTLLFIELLYRSFAIVPSFSGRIVDMGTRKGVPGVEIRRTIWFGNRILQFVDYGRKESSDYGSVITDEDGSFFLRRGLRLINPFFSWFDMSCIFVGKDEGRLLNAAPPFFYLRRSYPLDRLSGSFCVGPRETEEVFFIEACWAECEKELRPKVELEYCETLKVPSARNTCLSSLATERDNKISFCEKMTPSLTKAHCIRNYSPLAVYSDPKTIERVREICDEIPAGEEKDSCYLDLASGSGEKSYCELISTAGTKSRCKALPEAK